MVSRRQDSPKSGAGDRSRTYDLRITNALLYQLSYTGTGGAILSKSAVRLKTAGYKTQSIRENFAAI